MWAREQKVCAGGRRKQAAGPAHYIPAMVQVEIFVAIVRVLRTCADKLTQRYERLRDCDIQA